MYKHILIPVALDHEGVVANKIAAGRRLLAEDGRMTLLTVLEDIPGFVAEFVESKPENHLTARIKDELDRLASGADDISTEVIT
ncbi:MAG: universal stress protein, partial [Arenibacterium sp.]